MDQLNPHQCPAGPTWIQLFIAIVTGSTTVLTTWLTVRAARKDRAELEEQKRRVDKSDG